MGRDSRMTRHLKLAVYGTLLVFSLSAATLVHAAYDYIDISKPFLKKIPIAIPLIGNTNGSQTENQFARASTELLSTSLEFTGYFTMLDRGAFLVDENTPWAASGLNFKNWTAIGAELLTTGSVSVQDDLVELELRLYDTFKEKMIVGKRYKGWVKDQRKMIHRFCSDVIFILTGNRGVFDSRLAFESKSKGKKEILICSFDGYNPTSFTNNRNINLSPAWSYDGRWIAYTSYVKGGPDLFIRHVKDKRGTVVAKKGINITPAWVPGKFELAATLSFQGDPEIYLLTGTGKIIKRLTNSYGIDAQPTWSPDGKKMAFVSDRSGTPQIYIKALNSGRAERLSFYGKYNTSPAWSPKGDKIAYAGLVDGNFDIFVIKADGTGLFQLTDSLSDDESPSWSPDGSMIAFNSTREGPSRIYVMTAFGTDQRRLLALPGEQTNPEWSGRVTNN